MGTRQGVRSMLRRPETECEFWSVLMLAMSEHVVSVSVVIVYTQFIRP